MRSHAVKRALKWLANAALLLWLYAGLAIALGLADHWLRGGGWHAGIWSWMLATWYLWLWPGAWEKRRP
jgi:hypothetical protein